MPTAPAIGPFALCVLGKGSLMLSNVMPSIGQDHMENLDCTMKKKAKQRLRLEVELAGGRQKPVAMATGTDEGAFSRMLSDRYPESLPAHKVPAITSEMGPGFMEWLAIQCGGVYRHGEAEPAVVEDPLSLAGLLSLQAGRSVQQIIQDARSDNEWTALERQDAVPGLRKLIAVATSLLHEAEAQERAS